MSEIVLVAINAKYIHASFGLRYLMANLGALRARATMLEFQIKQRPVDVAERILESSPRIVGIGVYVWNAQFALELVEILRRVAPELIVVLGGPEVSHEPEAQRIVELAHHVIRGEADVAFAQLAARLLDAEPTEPVAEHVAWAPLPDCETLVLPYSFYSDEDLAHRVVYVEASRGCPFRCEFCLSALDEKVRTMPLAPFLAELETLYRRGARNFKFVDRTFNLDVARCVAILEFFAARVEPGLLVHFELIPDRLPDVLRPLIAGFPAGVLQFELGIQTFDDEVARRIERRQDVARIEANLRWLREHTGVHVHADLIVGLPGESVESFGRGFDALWALRPQEIQVGILKRLRGTPIVRHDEAWQMVYSAHAPYEILSNRSIDFCAMQEMKRFARYWDLVANSGHYPRTVVLLLEGGSAFDRFREFARVLHERLAITHGIAAPRLARALFEHVAARLGDPQPIAAAMLADALASRRFDLPEYLREHLTDAQRESIAVRRRETRFANRQALHESQQLDAQVG